jgi:hypothetical protein
MNLEVRNTPRAAAWSRGRRRKRAFFRQQGKHRSRFFFTGGIEKDSNETERTTSSTK